MHKENKKLMILATGYILGLIAYLFITINFILPLQIILLAVTFYLSYLITKKISSSDNSFLAKLYFSFISNAFLFFLVVFFCFAGRALYADTEAILSQLIIPYSTTLLGIIAFAIEISILSKTKAEKKTCYNLTLLNILLTILVIIFVGLYYYDSTIENIATNQQNPQPQLCKNLISIPNSILFEPSISQGCILWSSARTLDEKQCENVCNLKYLTDCNEQKWGCYSIIAFWKPDVNLCFKGLELNAEDVGECIIHAAVNSKNVSACEYLSGGKAYSEEIGNHQEDKTYNKDFCLLLMTPAVGDKTLCNSINDTEFREGCLKDYDSERQKFLE
jgi:hypothetical protein